jgi:hypothetical protein
MLTRPQQYRPRLYRIQSGMRLLAKNPKQQTGQKHRDRDKPERGFHSSRGAHYANTLAIDGSEFLDSLT